LANGERVIKFATRENIREHHFKKVWTGELGDAFADVAGYYERANHVASLGLWSWFRARFIASIEVRPGQRVLDVCAGTNSVGLALLRRQPALEVHAIDRSAAMQAVGRERAARRGLHIDNVFGDVHRLPFPDNHFDVVTLQYASRHLRILEVTREIRRVLKPGGHFYHGDMLRPTNPLIARLYYGYLRAALAFTAAVFRSGAAARNARDYFIDTLRMFYSTGEFTQLLRQAGFEDVTGKSLLGGMVGIHKAVKAPAR
jgi:demethylmenaquinone methyltransferase/2-methoxy-6-polyprenyl-1,4-benzoquinol methylase